jgi:hypothetical protein
MIKTIVLETQYLNLESHQPMAGGQKKKKKHEVKRKQTNTLSNKNLKYNLLCMNVMLRYCTDLPPLLVCRVIKWLLILVL